LIEQQVYKFFFIEERRRNQKNGRSELEWTRKMILGNIWRREQKHCPAWHRETQTGAGIRRNFPLNLPIF
jgi:hypothetical protein